MVMILVILAPLAYLFIASRFVLPAAQGFAAWHENEFPYLTRDNPASVKRQAVIFGFAAGLFWPLWIPLLLTIRAIVWMISFPASKVRFPSEIMDERYEMEKRHLKAQRRIAELERELGIKP